MDQIPTTPEGRSPPKKLPCSASSVVLHCPSTQLKVHPHGISAKKHAEETVSHEGSLFANSFDPNVSLDNIRRGRYGKTEQNAEVQSDDHSNALDQIDINKMFPHAGHCGNDEPKQESRLMLMNQSPIHIDMSSPVKQRDDDDAGVEDGENEPVSKKVKLELESVPNLTQGVANEQFNDINLSSPEAIEMIETKSSPIKDFSEINEEQEQQQGPGQHSPHQDVKGSEFQKSNERDPIETPPKNRSENILSLPQLIPVFNHNDTESSLNNRLQKSFYLVDNTDLKNSYEFQGLSKRNQELIEEIHSMNERVNDLTADNDLAFHEYKNIKMKLENSSSTYEAEIKKLNTAVNSISSDRDKYQERLNKLKQMLNESRDEIKMLNQNQSILQKKYETATKEADRWKKLSNEIEGNFLEMRSVAMERNDKSKEMEDKVNALTEKIASYETENTELEALNNEIKEKYNALEELLSKNDDELKRLKAQHNESLAAQKGASDEISNQLNDLVAAKHALELQLKVLQDDSKEKIALLNESVVEKKSLLESATKNFNNVQNSLQTLQNELTEKNQQLKSMQTKHESLDDESEIRKAEIAELNEKNEELKELNLTLENSVSQLEGKLKELRENLDRERGSPERETEYLKNMNIEAEHLAELEDLHANMSTLQECLKKNSDTISRLRIENESLKNNQQTGHIEHEKEPKEALISNLRKEVEDWKEKYSSKEQESNKSLKLLAEDLYIQYSSKHEQKVKLLKRGYETKYQSKLDKLNLKNEGLAEELQHLRNQLASERKEKQKLLSLIDENRRHKNLED